MARLLFLSRDPRLYTMQRFQAACRQLGHECRSLDPMAANVMLAGASAQVWAGGDPVLRNDVDVVVPRIGAGVTEAGCMVLHQFEVQSIPVVNSSRAIQDARDKLRALQILVRQGVPTPRTTVIRATEDIDDAIDQVGGVPCVVKLLEGTQGIGVMLAESREGLEAMLQAFWSLGKTVLLQEFVAESRGRDVRAFVVGDEVVAAMRREGPLGEFRSNIHRGGTGRPVALSKTDRDQVLAAVRALGLQVAGVDFLESKSGPQVIEVNASPGFQGLEQATGIDIAAAVVRYAAALGGPS
ncbi:MAG: ATP-grasp domain-containing protein [Thermoplasmatota archaeon]